MPMPPPGCHPGGLGPRWEEELGGGSCEGRGAGAEPEEGVFRTRAGGPRPGGCGTRPCAAALDQKPAGRIVCLSHFLWLYCFCPAPYCLASFVPLSGLLPFIFQPAWLFSFLLSEVPERKVLFSAV